MKKKNFLSGFSAKIALLVLAVSGAVLTGCYKDDGLDAQGPGSGEIVKGAVYVISGTVTDITTGANLSGFDLSVDAAGVTTQVDKVDGGYTVKIDKFDAESINVKLSFSKSGFNENQPIDKYVRVYKVADGNAVLYPLSVAMKPNGVKLVDVVYNLSFAVKDAETGATLDLTQFNLDIAPAATAENGNYVAGTYTVRTFTTTVGTATYLPSSTVVELPAAAVKEGVDNVAKRNITVYVSKASTPVDTYVNFSGNVIDKYGKPLQAKSVTLYNDANEVKGTVSDATNFRFTVASKDAGKYYVVAKYDGAADVKSSVYDLKGGNVDCILMFPTIGDVAPVEPIAATYNLYVNVLDADTKSPIVGADIIVDPNKEGLKNLAAGVYTINVTKTGEYHPTKSIVVLNEVMADKATTINYVATIYMTPISKEVSYANIAGLIVDKNGKALQATKVELFEKGKTVAVAFVEKTANFRFTVPAKSGLIYYVVATYTGGKTAKSTDYNINGGSVDCTLVFEDVDLDPVVPEQTEPVKYNLYVNVLAAGTNEKIANPVIEISDPSGKVTLAEKLMGIVNNYGVYKVTASADKYYSTATMVILEELKVVVGSPVVNKVVTIYLAKKDDPVIVPAKVILAGDVYDKRGILAKSQTIKLLNKDGKVLETVYGTDHYKFEQPSPEVAKATMEWTVVAEVINADATGVVKASTKYVYTNGMTEAYSEISFSVNIENGKVVKEEGTSTVTPPQNEDGEVPTTVTSVIDQNGNDKTTLTVEAGTKITNKDGDAVLTSLVLVRDKSEETDPSGGTTVGGEQAVTPRCYEGYPDGIYFSKPLEITFTDIYGAQLGEKLNLEYFENGKWSSDNAKALDGTSYKEIALNGNNYIMKVPHFSKFRASIASTVETKESTKGEDIKELTIDMKNENDQPLPGTQVWYTGKVGGWAFESPIEDIIKAKFTNANAQKVILAAINNFLSNKYNTKVENELKEAKILLATIDVPATTYIKSATVKFTKVVIPFIFKLNGVDVPFSIYTYAADQGGSHEVIKWDMVNIGHGHGHGHGGNLNAGGGIFVSE